MSATQYLRTYDEANVKGKRKEKYDYKKGSTAVLKENVKVIEVVDETVKPVVEKMETSWRDIKPKIIFMKLWSPVPNDFILVNYNTI